MAIEPALNRSSISYPTTPSELIDHAIEYSKTIKLPIDISVIHWTISRRATKRAACCKFSPGSPDILISLHPMPCRRLHTRGELANMAHEVVQAPL